MIFFDTTKAARSSHHSGLQRVSKRLLQALGSRATPGPWNTPALTRASRDAWFFTPELFSEEERPGFTDFLRLSHCRKAALFHDAIPLKHPEWIWPNSGSRHPAYLALLADFDLVFAVSEASRRELLAYWHWLGLATPPPVHVLPLGADFDGTPRQTRLTEKPAPLSLLSVGIFEPRKNQTLIAQACVPLWLEGLDFELHCAGRINPHFGKPVAAALRGIASAHRGLKLHKSPSDKTLARLFSKASALLMPSLAEGCGLPVLEALWKGIPCLCSQIPALAEFGGTSEYKHTQHESAPTTPLAPFNQPADTPQTSTPLASAPAPALITGGCDLLPTTNTAEWTKALRRLITDTEHRSALTQGALTRPLLSWADSANRLLQTLWY